LLNPSINVLACVSGLVKWRGWFIGVFAGWHGQSPVYMLW